MDAAKSVGLVVVAVIIIAIAAYSLTALKKSPGTAQNTSTTQIVTTLQTTSTTQLTTLTTVSSGNNFNYTKALAACAKAGVSYSNCPAYCQSNPSACGSSGSSSPQNSTGSYPSQNSTGFQYGAIATPCSQNTLLTVSPINASQLLNIEPLGHVSGPHILPSQGDHIYFYSVTAPDGTALLTPVYSPGNVTVTQISAAKSGNRYEPATSYYVYFSSCRNVTYGFQLPRVGNIILNYLASVKPLQCYNGTMQSSCTYGNLNLSLRAGDLLGYTGIHSPNSTGVKDDNSVDFAAADTRTKVLAFIDQLATTGFLPNTYKHAVCPLDYFANSTKAYLYGKLFSKNSSTNGIPACGTTMQDLPGTVQGNWYIPGSVAHWQNGQVNFSDSLSVIHVNADPAFGVVSAGGALLPTTNQGAQMPFRAQSSGQINREPSQVTADGRVYCYQGAVGYGVLYRNGTVNLNNGQVGHVDLRLDNATTLEVDYGSGSCAATPALSNPIVYVR